MPISKKGYHTMFIAGFSKSTGRPSSLFRCFNCSPEFSCVSNAAAVASGFEDPVLPYQFHHKKPPYYVILMSFCLDEFKFQYA